MRPRPAAAVSGGAGGSDTLAIGVGRHYHGDDRCSATAANATILGVGYSNFDNLAATARPTAP
jgi:hypothetical protein